MKKVETKCKSCNSTNKEPCELANYTTKIEGKTHIFCCQSIADKQKAKKK
jgi:hypothetical protein